jgi:multicomponent Na+:H+ antiporter subunit D
LVHLAGGVILMAGIIGHVAETGSIDFTALRADSIARILILIGFLVNAGAPSVSAWLPDAYPEGSPSGTVFLSAFTTKTAVFVLLINFPGEQILIWVGACMIFYGIIYALLENDMRCILAYSIVNQVGFMICGIGTEMARNGAAAHAFTHIIYKALLLMMAGSVLYMTGKRKCTELGGLFQTMPITMVCGTIGALAISSFPFTSGFISKNMIAQGAIDQHLTVVWFLLAAASAGVFLHAGIKFSWFVFFQKDSGLRPPEPPQNMRVAMYLFAAFCIGLGVWPGPLYDILPFPVSYEPYTGDHLVFQFQFQLLLFAGLAFFVMLPMMKRTETISLDFDWFYRRFFRELAKQFTYQSSVTRDGLEAAGRRRLSRFIDQLYRHHGPQGILARTWPTGSTVLWVAILLGVSVLMFYV